MIRFLTMDFARLEKSLIFHLAQTAEWQYLV